MPFLPFAKYTRLTVLLFLYLCFFSLSGCQEDLIQPAYFGTITGTVVDARTNLPLANASVTTNPATSSYITDAQGKFEIKDVPAGRVAITVSKTDYQQVVANVNVTDGQTAAVTVQLAKATAASVSAPDRPSPINQATNQSLRPRFSWRPPANSVRGDSLRYDFILYEGNSTTPVISQTNLRDTTYTPQSSLRANTTYFWNVTARNPAGAMARSQTWTFQTGALADNRFLFVRTTGFNSDIYAADAAGTNSVQLTSSPAMEIEPRLSPNRDVIAYTSNVTGKWQLYIMNRDGTNPRQLTTTYPVEGDFNNGIGYCWSPDGSQLLYSYHNQLLRINRDGTGRTIIASAPTGKSFRECDWTDQNGGRIIAQVVGSSINESAFYLYDVTGTQQGTGPVIPDTPGRLDSPSFSLDGRSILYTQDTPLPPSTSIIDYPTGRQVNSHIFLKRLDNSLTVDISAINVGSGAANARPVGSNDLTPRFSPNGASVIFVNQDNSANPLPEIGTNLPQVLTMDVVSGIRTKLFDNAFMPDWR